MSPLAAKKGVSGSVAVAINTSKGSQSAFKWALENLLTNGQDVSLIHVSRTSSSGYSSEPQNKDIFLPFRCFARRKDVRCKTTLLEETNVAKALIDYVSSHSIEHLVLGVPAKPNFLRFKTTEISYTVSKEAPDFCTVYIISRGKISSTRSATRAAPLCSKNNTKPSDHEATPTPPIPSNPFRSNYSRGVGVCFRESPQNLPPDICSWAQGMHHRVRTSSASTLSSSQSECSSNAVSRSCSPRRRQSNSSECIISSSNSSYRTQWLSDSTDSSLVGSPSRDNYSSIYQCSSDDCSISPPASPPGDAESEMIKRLQQELKQTMEMYNAACKEAVLAKQVAQELERFKQDEERRSKMAAEATKTAKQSNNNSEAASRRLLRAQVKRSREIKREKEAEEKHYWGAVQSIKPNFTCKKYTIDEIEAATEFFSKTNKIGEGVYGPVYKGFLDHVSVAIRILHPDVAQEMSQFQQQVEALSSIRHPNMVVLLGSCPEYGCLVYECMSRGSLEDLLFLKGRTPIILSWQLRFKIAAEIAAGLSFLHQTKPKPIVHRDLNPANILIDENFTSKISDVGLAGLVPPYVSDSITECRSTTGTFCYIDPEYQQTGRLGVKSDVYSLGIMLLQLITAKPPMGVTHRVQSAIENGNLVQVLDPLVPDWPLEETLSFAKLALKCSKLRRKDRPELHQVVVPELNRLRTLAEESMHHPTSQDKVSMSLGMLSPPPELDDIVFEEFPY